MKKTLICLIAMLSLILFAYGSSYAVQGQCSNCHTMHASQNGTFPTGMTSGPNGYLLVAGCIPCHTQNGAGQGAMNSFPAPIVWHTTAPAGQGGGYTLAGGDFYWVADSNGNTDSMGHNVATISGTDAAIAANLGNYVPPGWDAAATPGALNDGPVAGGTWNQQLNCAGTFGCHGVHNQVGDFPGIKGAHHSNTGVATTQASSPTSIGNSFRFLSGIKGLEQSQWNWTESASSHNEYYGIDDSSARNAGEAAAGTYSDKGTISYFCAECHGRYHASIASAGAAATPWLRHPTDIVLGRAAGTEYSAYNPDSGNNYSVEAPVARPTVPATSSATVVPTDSSGDTGAIVSCLSCHRAHGSNQPDLLRWSYSGIVAGSGTADTGCFTCHTTKNAD